MRATPSEAIGMDDVDVPLTNEKEDIAPGQPSDDDTEKVTHAAEDKDADRAPAAPKSDAVKDPNTTCENNIGATGAGKAAPNDTSPGTAQNQPREDSTKWPSTKDKNGQRFQPLRTKVKAKPKATRN